MPNAFSDRYGGFNPRGPRRPPTGTYFKPVVKQGDVTRGKGYEALQKAEKSAFDMNLERDKFGFEKRKFEHTQAKDAAASKADLMPDDEALLLRVTANLDPDQYETLRSTNPASKLPLHQGVGEFQNLVKGRYAAETVNKLPKPERPNAYDQRKRDTVESAKLYIGGIDPAKTTREQAMRQLAVVFKVGQDPEVMEALNQRFKPAEPEAEGPGVMSRFKNAWSALRGQPAAPVADPEEMDDSAAKDAREVGDPQNAVKLKEIQQRLLKRTAVRPAASAGGDIRARAAQFLKENGEPETAANIEAIIQRGLVK